MTTQPMPTEWANKLIVCNKCGQTSMKAWAKQTEQGTLCQRCHPSVVGFTHPYLEVTV
jgi:formylmethanofuran dehydrogenase subunit E